MTITITHDRVMKVYNWFRDSMYKVGRRRINPPKDIRYENTYQYIGVRKFVNNVDKWKLSDDDVKLLLDILVRYAKERRILSKGAAILTMNNIIEICKQKLEEEIKYSDSFTDRIQEAFNFVKQERGSLLIKEHKGGFTNITRWFRGNRLPLELITVSKTCLNALNKLDESERDSFPSGIELLSMRIKILSDPDRYAKLNSILGPDLQSIGIN